MDEKTSSAPMQEDPQKGEELSFTITGEDAEAQDALNAKKPEPQQKKKSPLPWILGAAAVIIAAALVLILTIKPSQTTPDADQPGDATPPIPRTMPSRTTRRPARRMRPTARPARKTPRPAATA